MSKEEIEKAAKAYVDKEWDLKAQANDVTDTTATLAAEIYTKVLNYRFQQTFIAGAESRQPEINELKAIIEDLKLEMKAMGEQD